MTDNPASKSGKPDKKLRVDHEEGLIFIPGQDQPKELIAPIVQRIDAEGVPYQHVMTASEMIDAENQSQRCMRFIRDAMRMNWECVQCHVVRPGSELRVDFVDFTTIMKKLLEQQERVKWQEIIEQLSGRMFCRNPKCTAPCVPVQEAQG